MQRMNVSWAIGVVLTVFSILGTLVGVIAFPPGLARDALLFVCAILTILLSILVTQLLFHSVDIISIVQTLRNRGISRIHGTGTVGSIGVHIRQARHIRIMAISANALIKSHRDEIVSCLRDQAAKIQVLLAEPNSAFVQEVEEIESDHRVGQISPEILNAEKLLSEYLDQARRTAAPNTVLGVVEIGYYSTQFRSSIIICDAKWGWLTLSLAPKRALQTLSFELLSYNDGLLSDCMQHFDHTWEAARKRGRVRILH